MIYKINSEFKKYATIDSAKELINELNKEKEQISCLDLSMNTYSPIVCSEISKIIKQMNNLKSIKLESIFDSLTFSEMSSVLTSLCNALPRTLISFELPSNAVSCDFPDSFANFISECPLTILNLYNCGLGKDGLERISSCLNKLKNKENLEILNLSKNRINSIEDSFGNILSKFRNLREFKIRNNTICETSMNTFLKSLKINNLETLDLSDNFVCADCMESLGTLFIQSSIKHLYLHDCKMDDGDLNVFLEICNSKRTQGLPGGISNTKQDLTLDISCNDFQQDSVPLLEVLSSRFSIKKLILFENCYSDIEHLKELVIEGGGVIVDEEDEEIFEIGENIIQALKGL